MGRPKINTGTCLNCSNVAITKSLCSSHYKKLYYSLNKEKENKSRREHNHKNKDKMALRKRNREKTDLSYKIANRLRHRLYSAVKGGGSIDYLGCSIEEFKVHIESQFKENMTWDNWTNFGWHIDHIIPLASVDLSIQANLEKVCHFSNLRPLWWNENLGRNYGH